LSQVAEKSVNYQTEGDHYES
jgi:hypothetical protein